LLFIVINLLSPFTLHPTYAHQKNQNGARSKQITKF